MWYLTPRLLVLGAIVRRIHWESIYFIWLSERSPKKKGHYLSSPLLTLTQSISQAFPNNLDMARVYTTHEEEMRRKKEALVTKHTCIGKRLKYKLHIAAKCIICPHENPAFICQPWFSALQIDVDVISRTYFFDYYQLLLRLSICRHF